MLKSAIIFTLLIFFISQRIRTTYTDTKRRAENFSDQFFASFMILLYASILALAIFDFITNNDVNWFLSSFGLLLLIFSIAVRTTARRTLGNLWSLYTLTKPKRLIKIGLYQFIRHPYYLGSLLEILSFALILNSTRAAILIFLLYLPLTYFRAIIEEKILNKTFGFKFRRYLIQTNSFFSWSMFGSSKILRRIKQIISVWRSFSFKRLLELKYLDSTIKDYARPFFVTQVISTLLKIGFIDRLNKGDVNLKSFCVECNYDFKIMKIICDYLFLVGVLEKRNISYSLSNSGTKLFSISRGVFSLVYAYAPIFDNLEGLIKKEIVYGRDIDRRGEFVGRGSAELATLLPFPIAAKMMRQYDCKTVLDLGCGSGEFLLNFCQSNGFYGFGLDVSRDAINYAKKCARDLGMLKTHVEFEVGNIFDLRNSPFYERDIDMICSMFVLHEFIEDDKMDKVVHILKEIKTHFPRSLILICELCKESLKDLKKRSSGVTEHHLFHALSKQEIAPISKWHGVFKSAGLKLEEEYLFEPAEQAYFVLKNTTL